MADFPVVPVQILDGCLRALVPTSRPHAPIITPPLPMKVAPAVDRTWFSELQMFLPHSWVDSSLVTAKAAKRDDANVPSQLWDARCLLMFPYLTKVITILRARLLIKASHRMMDEFRAYLRSLYGPSWAVLLMEIRRLRSQGRFSVTGKRHRGGRGMGENKNYTRLSLLAMRMLDPMQ
jgi:hypothetical protein